MVLKSGCVMGGLMERGHPCPHEREARTDLDRGGQGARAPLRPGSDTFLLTNNESGNKMRRYTGALFDCFRGNGRSEQRHHVD